MSEAATQVLSPISKTAQSSPTGTSTSGGAGGRRAEILRTTSSSFNPALCRTNRGGRKNARNAGSPRARAPGPRPRRPPLRGPERPSPPSFSARPREGPTPQPGPPSRTVPRLRARLPRRAAFDPDFSKRGIPRSLRPQERSSLHLPDGFPEHVGFLLRVPGTQRAPAGFGNPRVGVVGLCLRFYLTSGMACQEAHAGVKLRIVGGAPRLDPGPPGVFDPGRYTGLFVQLAAGAIHKVLAYFEHAAGVLPEPDGRLATPEQKDLRFGVIEID